MTTSHVPPRHAPTWERLKELWLSRDFDNDIEKREYELGFEGFRAQHERNSAPELPTSGPQSVPSPVGPRTDAYGKPLVPVLFTVDRAYRLTGVALVPEHLVDYQIHELLDDAFYSGDLNGAWVSNPQTEISVEGRAPQDRVAFIPEVIAFTEAEIIEQGESPHG